MSVSAIKNLENFLELTAIRQKVISRNLANVNTEYYKREEVSFDDVMAQNLTTQMKVTNELHMGSPETDSIKDMHIKIVQDDKTTYNSGINNVNVDKEMSDLAENTILFKFASRKINGYFKELQDVIKGSRA